MPSFDDIRDMRGWQRWLTLCALLAGLVAATTPARADGDPRTDAVPRMMPYEGYLERDGQPVDARGDDALRLLFALYDGPDTAQPVYSQPLRVEVYGGQFTATIGPVGQGPDGAERAIADVVAAADDLHLGLTLLGDPEDPDDDVPLSRRQPIRATPYALWTTAATDITIARDAQIDGDLAVGGALAAGGLRVGGAVELPGDAIDGAEVADGSLGAGHLDPAVAGRGVRIAGGRLRLDGGVVDGETRAYVRVACHLRLGWRNGCNNCGDGPAKNVTVRADGTCTGASGSDTRCRANNTWGGVNIDGAASTDDVFYIRMICN